MAEINTTLKNILRLGDSDPWLDKCFKGEGLASLCYAIAKYSATVNEDDLEVRFLFDTAAA